jgi:hypothetical protein
LQNSQPFDLKMATIQQLKKRFIALKGREMEFAAIALQQSEEFALDLVAGQLAQGIKSDGTKANFSYAPSTIASKNQRTGLSSVTSHLTNYDTGESYRGLYMLVNGDNVKFGTHTDKEDAISERMDGEAFRPTKQNKEDLVREKMQPIFLKLVREAVKI